MLRQQIRQETTVHVLIGHYALRRFCTGEASLNNSSPLKIISEKQSKENCTRYQLQRVD